jgi:hypothetical protein
VNPVYSLSHQRMRPSSTHRAGSTPNWSGEKITISARNLSTEARTNMRLFAGTLRHPVPWIQEADEPRPLKGQL